MDHVEAGFIGQPVDVIRRIQLAVAVDLKRFVLGRGLAEKITVESDNQ